MELILSIILIVFSVLQIILFFKVWAMTNDVRKIANKIVTPKHLSDGYFEDDYAEFLYYIYNNEKDKAREVLQECMWKSMSMARMVNARKIELFDEYYKELKEFYGKWYELLGEDFPTYSHMRERLK